MAAVRTTRLTARSMAAFARSTGLSFRGRCEKLTGTSGSRSRIRSVTAL